MTIHIPIAYILIEDNRGGRATMFHLLNGSELSLLRCFMTLLQLPENAASIIPKGHMFVEALARLQQLPRFRKASSEPQPPEPLWKDMQRLPLLVLMLNDTPPLWLETLIQEKPVAVLTPSEEIMAVLSEKQNVFPGLLRGMEDIKEFYRVLGKLSTAVAADDRLDPNVSLTLRALGQCDLLASRSRLPFLLSLPLPQPSEGRAALYLFNRLSNNVDEPALMNETIENGGVIAAEILDIAVHACVALSFVDMNEKVPDMLSISREELEDVHGKLMSKSEDNNNKFRAFMKIGRKLCEGRPLKNPFFTIPVPRLDLLRGRVPEGIYLDADYKLHIKNGLQAVSDITNGTEQKIFTQEKEKNSYSNARFTFLSEQRLLACQTASLAAMSGTIPIQLPPMPSTLFNVLRDLSRALETDSRKISNLFRSVERQLAEVMPQGILGHLNSGQSSVILYSDLPFEWTLINEWPLCLTRPVARIPTSISHWDVLCNALEYPASIDISKPERVLVFDLIDAHDTIRKHSEAFIAASGNLGQNYSYVSPRNANDFRAMLRENKPEIVVLDAHGSYNRRKDELTIRLKGNSVPIDDLLPDERTPAVWILSSCETSVTGAMRGCFVRKLLSKGAICVIATLARVDAFTAQMLVGRLLTDIYNPVHREMYDSLDEVFFATQYTTALLYDPLLPLIRRSSRERALMAPVAKTIGEYLHWAVNIAIDVRTFGHDSAKMLGELIEQNGLMERYKGIQQAGLVRPETLLFTAFGVPKHIKLRK